MFSLVDNGFLLGQTETIANVESNASCFGTYGFVRSYWHPVYCLQLVFEEVIEKVKEKEMKEAKKWEKLVDDFRDLLCSVKVYILYFVKNPFNEVSFSLYC